VDFEEKTDVDLEEVVAEEVEEEEKTGAKTFLVQADTFMVSSRQ